MACAYASRTAAATRGSPHAASSVLRLPPVLALPKAAAGDALAGAGNDEGDEEDADADEEDEGAEGEDPEEEEEAKGLASRNATPSTAPAASWCSWCRAAHVGRTSAPLLGSATMRQGCTHDFKVVWGGRWAVDDR